MPCDKYGHRINTLNTEDVFVNRFKFQQKLRNYNTYKHHNDANKQLTSNQAIDVHLFT